MGMYPNADEFFEIEVVDVETLNQNSLNQEQIEVGDTITVDAGRCKSLWIKSHYEVAKNDLNLITLKLIMLSNLN
jgi:hypothetical protein